MARGRDAGPPVTTVPLGWTQDTARPLSSDLRYLK